MEGKRGMGAWRSEVPCLKSPSKSIAQVVIESGHFIWWLHACPAWHWNSTGIHGTAAALGTAQHGPGVGSVQNTAALLKDGVRLCPTHVGVFLSFPRIVWDSGLSWLSWSSVQGGDIAVATQAWCCMYFPSLPFPFLLPMLGVPYMIHIVSLTFCSASYQKIFSSWALASILPSTLWFNRGQFLR